MGVPGFDGRVAQAGTCICSKKRSFFVLVCFATVATPLACIYITTIYQSTTVIQEPASQSGHLQSKKHSTPHNSVSTGKHQSVLQRGRALRKRCRKLYGGEPNEMHHKKFKFIFVSDKYKLLYCHVPKVASTTVGKLFMFLEGETNKTNASRITATEVLQFYHRVRRLRTFTEAEVRYRLKHYKKLVIVREPLERLVSAFNNKLVCWKGVVNPADGGYYCNISRQMINKVRGNRSQKQYKQNNQLTFAEFLKFLILESSTNRKLDQHWNTYMDLCYPCHVQYNYIGKYETFYEDMNVIRREIRAPGQFTFPNKPGKSVDLIQKLIKGIPKATLRRVKDIYANDTFLFDYQFAGV